MSSNEIRKQFYRLIVSQLLKDCYKAEATALRVSEDLREECQADDELFHLIKPHLQSERDKNMPKTVEKLCAKHEKDTEVQLESAQKELVSRQQSKESPVVHNEKEENRVKDNSVSPIRNTCDNIEDAQPPQEARGADKPVNSRRSRSSYKLKPATCNGCQSVFNNPSGLYEHLAEKHMTITEAGCVCKHCNRAVKNKYTLNAHLKTHSEVNHILCPDCGKGFKRTTDYKDHRQKMHEMKKYPCPDCSNTYNLLRSLQKHVSEVHKQPGRHICLFCGKQFNSSNQLKMHEMVHHTKEKPHSCKICSTSFRSSGHLQNHMLLHKGVKEFKCGLCDHRVYQKGNMKSHMKIHSSLNNNIFWCSDCKQAWPSQSELSDHSNTCDGTQTKASAQSSNIPSVEKRSLSQSNVNSKRMKFQDGTKVKDSIGAVEAKPVANHEASKNSSLALVINSSESRDERRSTISDNIQCLDKNPNVDNNTEKHRQLSEGSDRMATERKVSAGETRFVVSHNGKEIELLMPGEPNVETVQQLVQQLVRAGSI